MTIDVILAFTFVYGHRYAGIHQKKILFFSLSQDTFGKILWTAIVLTVDAIVLTVDGRVGPQASSPLHSSTELTKVDWWHLLDQILLPIEWRCLAQLPLTVLNLKQQRLWPRQKNTSAYNYHNQNKTKSTVTVLLIVCFAAPKLFKISVSGSPRILLLGPISYGLWRIKTFLNAHLPALLLCQHQ